MNRLTSGVLALLQMLCVTLGVVPDATESDYANVFVPGLFGWGDEVGLDSVHSYWNIRMLDTTHVLSFFGYDSYKASIGPVSSTWDRTCELYAELTGTTVDYGEAHAKEHNHARFGRSYATPLVAGWGEEGGKKLNLFGHSFGGATVRLFAQLCCEGSQAERAATAAEELSPLFAGELGDAVHSVTTMAAPHNGTTFVLAANNTLETYLLSPLIVLGLLVANVPYTNALYDFHFEHYGLTPVPGSELWQMPNLQGLLDVLSGKDHAFYELSITGANDLNRSIHEMPGIYYFSYAGKTTHTTKILGFEMPNKEMFAVLKLISLTMGLPVDYTIDGVFIDETWRANDGLVNTVSAMYPTDAAHVDFDPQNIQPGVWNVMPISERDHLDFVSDISSITADDITLLQFYLQHFGYLESTYAQAS